MEEVTKLGIVEEDEQKYINKEVDRMAKMVLNKEELNGEARDANDDDGDTISESQESGEPEDEISLEPLTGQVGGMRVMVSLEGGDARLREGGEGPGGDNGGGDGEQVVIEPRGDKEQVKKFENININKLISDWDRRECSGLLGDELGGDGQRERRRRSQEFQNHLSKFEELGKKKEDELLVGRDLGAIHKNRRNKNTELCVQKPSTSPGPVSGEGGKMMKKFIQQKLCVSRYQPIGDKIKSKKGVVAGEAYWAAKKLKVSSD